MSVIPFPLHKTVAIESDLHVYLLKSSFNEWRGSINHWGEATFWIDSHDMTINWRRRTTPNGSSCETRLLVLVDRLPTDEWGMENMEIWIRKQRVLGKPTGLSNTQS